MSTGPKAEIKAIDDPAYFGLLNSNDDDPHYVCLECRSTSSTTLSITHEPSCMTWLRVRIESVLPQHPKLKFQLGKLLLIPGESYPRYVCHLVAPFLFESGSVLTDDYQISMIDARAPIVMNKAEMAAEDKDYRFKLKRIEATHHLLDFVDKGVVPVSGGGPDAPEELKVWQWGTLEDWKVELGQMVQRVKGIIPS